MARTRRGTARQHLGGETRRSVLPGGLRVLTEDMPGSHSFSIGVFAGTGSRHEAAHLHGVSHFLEHVLFKGTRRRTPEEISAAIEQVGGDINAYTSKEHTCFHAKVMSEDSAIAVDVLADMVSSSLILPDDLEAERLVILDEIAMYHDDPAELASELVAAKLFAGSALERSVIGTRASILGLDREQVVSFWKRHYRSTNLVVAAAGALDHDALVEQLLEFDQSVSGGTPGRQRIASPQPDSGAVQVRSRPLEHAQAVLGFASPGVFTDDPAAEGGRTPDPRRLALNLLAIVLGGGMSSRLFQEVRERRGLAYAIDAGEQAYTDAGTFTVEWGCAPERMVEITALVRDCLRSVVDEPVTPEELERAIGQIRGQTMLGYEGPTARMSRLGTAELAGDTRLVEEVLDSYRQVGADQLQEVAADVLASAPVLGVVGGRVYRSGLNRIVERWF